MTKPRYEVLVGLFVFIGFLILSMIVFFVSGVYFFRQGYRLKAEFEYVGIIKKGSPVRFSGVKVGEVSDVRLLGQKSANDPAKVEVSLFIEKGVVIRENYEVSVRGNHIMSEPHIAIIPVRGESRILKDSDIIPHAVSPILMEELFEEGQSIFKRMNQILEDVGTAFEDPKTRAMLYDSLTNMNELLKSMNQIVSGDEDEFRDMVVNVNRVADQMAETLERINQSEGTFGKLIAEDEVYNDLRDFIREIKDHPWRLFKKG